MTRPFSAQRLAILVDVQNIYYPAKSLGDKVDFHSLLRRFSNRNLVRAIAYVVEAPDVDISPFVTALRSIGFEVKTKPIKIFDDGTRKGDIDMMLALDALSLADKVDVVCLVSGDGVYVDLVHHLHARGVKVELVSFKSNTSSELLRIADSHLGMNEEFLLGYERNRGGDRSRSGNREGRHARAGGGNDRRGEREERSYGERGYVERERHYAEQRNQAHYSERNAERNHGERQYNERTYGERQFGERQHGERQVIERHYGDRSTPERSERRSPDRMPATGREAAAPGPLDEDG